MMTLEQIRYRTSKKNRMRVRKKNCYDPDTHKVF